MIKQLTLANLILLLGVVVYLFLSEKGTANIAYVRTGDIMERYLGMQEARSTLSQEVAALQQRSDTLHRKVLELNHQLVEQKNDLTDQALKEMRQEMHRRNEEYQRFMQNMQSKVEEEEMRLLGGAVLQINDFVERYGKERGFKMILGATDAGNLMYANEGIDITEEVLSALNETYAL